jgi:hypothetical protein
MPARADSRRRAASVLSVRGDDDELVAADAEEARRAIDERAGARRRRAQFRALRAPRIIESHPSESSIARRARRGTLKFETWAPVTIATDAPRGQPEEVEDPLAGDALERDGGGRAELEPEF